jgi:hypothetical protein
MDNLSPAGDVNAQQPASADANPTATPAVPHATEAYFASGLAMLSAQIASMQKALAHMFTGQPQSVPALPVTMHNASCGAQHSVGSS